jgi:hypothetical protein
MRYLSNWEKWGWFPFEILQTKLNRQRVAACVSVTSYFLSERGELSPVLEKPEEAGVAPGPYNSGQGRGGSEDFPGS